MAASLHGGRTGRLISSALGILSLDFRADHADDYSVVYLHAAPAQAITFVCFVRLTAAISVYFRKS